MLDRQLMMKRLVLIKLLYKMGMEQSYQYEKIAAFSILTLHDSVEMFLKLLSEHRNVDASNIKFQGYWTSIPDLTLKESMMDFNARRVNLKHKGLLPAISEIEISRVNVTNFLEQNIQTQFDIDFKAISLIDLVKNNKVKKYLMLAQKKLEKDKYMDSVENSAYAFDELLDSYKNSKDSWMFNPFSLGKRLKYSPSTFNKAKNHELSDEFEQIGKFMADTVQTISALQTAAKVTMLGIDYREFSKFDILTPHITRMAGGRLIAEIFGERKWTKENCQYCIDFVVKSSLKVQDFDYNINHLMDNRVTINIDGIDHISP